MSDRTSGWPALGWTLMRYALSGIFLYAGALKLWDPAAFAASIVRFQLVPELLVHPLALGLPPLEILLGLSLLFGPWKRQAALGVTILCLVFLVGLASAGLRGIEVDCSCFGASTSEPLWLLILRDVLLLAAAISIYARLNRVRQPGRDVPQTSAQVRSNPLQSHEFRSEVSA